jgi:hypothetical protein
MDSGSIISSLKKSIVTLGVGIVCGAIGAIEGAISGATGASILTAGYNVAEAAIVSSAGIGLLGAAEGLILGALAVNKFFGSVQDMEKNGHKNIAKRILGYFGYTANQIVGGVIAGLFLIGANSAMSFGDIVAVVAVGASITGVVITPIVTALAVSILAAAYSMTKSEESPIIL